MSFDPSRKEIERPLAGAAGRAPRNGPSLLSRIPFFQIAAALAIVAASSAIAFRERPYRDPPQTLVAEPEAAGDEAGDARVAAAAQRPSAPDGPSIMEVGPPPEPANLPVIIRDPSAVGQNARVAHLPDRALLEDSAHGPLPVRAADGRRPFDVYARPWSGARGARVAIIIGGLGVSQTGTQAAIEALPEEVTLAFATGGNSLDRWMQAARRAGHEIVVQLPMEPYDYPNVDPGRGTLTVDAPSEALIDELHWSLARITNYTGVMNYMGARFVTDRAAMSALMGELGRRGLMYVDDGSAARSLAEPLAGSNEVPFVAADTAIDAVRERGAILEKLDQLERVARAKGHAVGTGSAFEVTVEAVSAWAAEARRRGIEIVPISALATDPARD